MKVIASILPKEIKVGIETMSDQELDARINLLTERMGLKLVQADTVESQTAETGKLLPDSRKN